MRYNHTFGFENSYSVPPLRLRRLDVTAHTALSYLLYAHAMGAWHCGTGRTAPLLDATLPAEPAQ